MMLKSDFILKNAWIWSLILYLLSWVWYGGPNLSFLAWVAFVPLFIYQERNQKNFWRFVGASYAVIQAWTLISAGWLFHFPTSKWLIVGTIFSETLHIAFPFVVLYYLSKGIGYQRALWLLPFIWPVWEWLVLPMQHTTGTHLLPYGQGSNIWLIQIADLGGMWMISTWVLLFNVLVFKALKATDYEWKNKSFGIASLKVAFGMIIPVLLYFLICNYTYNQDNEDRFIQTTLLSTQFPPDVINGEEYQEGIIENILHRTDSLAFHLIDSGTPSQLFVWPESGTRHWQNFTNITSTFQAACEDWSASLLTGSAGIPIHSTERIAHISGVLVSPYYLRPEERLQYHHKSRLLPVTERVPYPSLLGPLFEIDNRNQVYWSEGTSYEPLTLTTEAKDKYRTGISLCYEQWHPSVWAEQVSAGAEYMVHMAQEGWYGNAGFAQYMANVCRIRAVESRRSVARSSNCGITTFISPVGRFYKKVPYDTVASTTGQIRMSSKRTLFSHWPNWYPWSCIGISMIGLILEIKNRENSCSKLVL